MRPSSTLLHPPLPHRSQTFSSEEDNDPLTDDGSPAISSPSSLRQSTTAQHRGQATLTARPGSPPLRSRLKHTLSPHVVSDDGVDSPTYDGDIESSTTVGRDRGHPSPVQPHSAVTSTLPSPTPHMPELPAAVNVIPPPSTASSSDAEIVPAHVNAHHAHDTSQAFTPSTLTPEDIRAFVRRAINGESHRKFKINEPPTDRPVRIYADGASQPRLAVPPAKLSFPNVYLLIGVNNDEQVKEYKFKCVMDYAERCESVRQCRWVDEVVPDAPWVIDAAFIQKYNIDYVAHDEEPYLSAGHEDVYAFVKSLGKFLPTRRTPGVSTSALLERIVKSYRKRDFDKKLEKMGHTELMAQGSDYEDKGVSDEGSSGGKLSR
ncbi:hypothetical protein EI94DRAFT_1808545 [Lactarius quietus]|nr:hypothetical protein EI94DRAFT_1808545 [Lactarius quietus]